MTMTSEQQRIFIPGESWLYYKLYCGPKTADTLLVETIGPLAGELQLEGLVDRWFFIRFNDPKLHLRVRFHLPDVDRIATLMIRMRQALRPYVEQDLLAKVQLDTYQRELERYGRISIQSTEDLFYRDSELQVRSLAVYRGDQGEALRWQFGLLSIDRLLDDFGLTLEEKERQTSRIRESYFREFGGGKGLKIKLDDKYRKERPEIERILRGGDAPDEYWQKLLKLLAERTRHNRTIAEEIKKALVAPGGKLELNDLLGSYVHMLVNRLFRTRQRAHELVLYDFLLRYYKSNLARRELLNHPVSRDGRTNP
jgi:thiopeptide-type bacteriocin biosynthesis protein